VSWFTYEEDLLPEDAKDKMEKLKDILLDYTPILDQIVIGKKLENDDLITTILYIDYFLDLEHVCYEILDARREVLGLPKDNIIDVDNDYFKNIIKRLKENDPTLINLDFSDKELSEESNAELITALDQNQSLMKLNLGTNKTVINLARADGLIDIRQFGMSRDIYVNSKTTAIIQQNPRANRKTYSKQHPLHCAIIMEDFESAKAMIKEDVILAQLNNFDKNLRDPILIAKQMAKDGSNKKEAQEFLTLLEKRLSEIDKNPQLKLANQLKDLDKNLAAIKSRDFTDKESIKAKRLLIEEFLEEIDSKTIDILEESKKKTPYLTDILKQHADTLQILSRSSPELVRQSLTGRMALKNDYFLDLDYLHYQILDARRKILGLPKDNTIGSF
jgi:hypothetical protein